VSNTPFYENTPSCGVTHNLERKKHSVINCEMSGKYVFVVNLDNAPLQLCEVKVWANAKETDLPKPAPPPPSKPRPFGARRRSPATSFKPKGKKMLEVTKLPLKNKWHDLGLGYGSAQVKSQGFTCMLSGVITGPAYGLLAEVPPVCRPEKTLIFGANSHYGSVKLTLEPSGEVNVEGGENKWLSLNGITYSLSSYHRKITLKNGWMNFDTKRFPYANFVVENRICVLGGVIFAGQFDVVGVLSPECRPLSSKVFNAPTGADLDKTARINVYPDGRIVWTGGQQDEAFLSLSGISFAAQRYKQAEEDFESNVELLDQL
jgi:hypothetical protein